MQIAAFAVPPHARELEDRPGAGDQQLLHGELRAGVQPERFTPAIGVFAFGSEGPQVDLLARGRNGVRRLDLGVAAPREERARSLRQQGAAAQERQACGKPLRMPGWLRHGGNVTPCTASPPQSGHVVTLLAANLAPVTSERHAHGPPSADSHHRRLFGGGGYYGYRSGYYGGYHYGGGLGLVLLIVVLLLLFGGFPHAYY